MEIEKSHVTINLQEGLGSSKFWNKNLILWQLFEPTMNTENASLYKHPPYSYNNLLVYSNLLWLLGYECWAWSFSNPAS